MSKKSKKKLLANVPIIVGFLILLYFGGGAFAPALGHAIMVIASLLAMAYLAWIILPALNREQEEQRKRAKEQDEADQQCEVRREKNRNKKRR